MAFSKRAVYKKGDAITDLPLYHSGPFDKKYTRDKDFKMCYGEIRGSTLFMYKDETQDSYTDRVDLQLLKCMTTDYVKWRESPIFALGLEKDRTTLQLKMNNGDTAEEWRGVILTVANKEIPSNLKLLPGQLMRLKEILVQELRRQAPCPLLPPRPAFLTKSTPTLPTPSPQNTPEQNLSNMPPCFYNVTRQQAEQMLHDNPEYGGIILRPSTLTNNYAVTLRHVSRSGPVIRNYRVTAIKSGFVIQLDTPVEVESLEEVLLYLIAQTEYRLQPYMNSQSYDTRIELSPAPKCSSKLPAPAKVLLQAQVAPMVCHKEKQDTLPLPRAENEYVIPYEKILQQANVKDTLYQILQDDNFSIC